VYRPRVVHLAGHPDLVEAHNPGAAAGPRGGQARVGALADQVALELGQRGKDVEHELAAGGGGGHRLLQAAEPDTPVGERSDGVDQVAQRPAKPVKLPHHQGVAGAELVQDAVQLGGGWPARRRRHWLVGEHAVAAGRGERVDLEVKVLLGGGYAGHSQARRRPVSRGVGGSYGCRRAAGSRLAT
jgi:hypothetical protein